MKKTGNFDESEVTSTTAIKNDSDWIINGEKLFVNDAVGADYFIVASKSNEREVKEFPCI